MKLEFTCKRTTKAARFVEASLPFVRRAMLQKLFRKNEIKAGGKPIDSNAEIVAGESVTVFLPDARRSLSDLIGCTIIAETEDFIAIDKRAGLASVAGTGTRRADLKSALETLLDEKIIAVHRLDQDTSGVIIFAKNQTTARNLEEEFRNRNAKKTYHAVIERKPKEKSGQIDLPLKKINQKVKPDPRGQSAETSWKSVKQVERGYLLECQPRTGRTHQIRVHLASQLSPIVGDSLYGAKSVKDLRRFLLHASRLEISGDAFEARLPKEFAE